LSRVAAVILAGGRGERLGGVIKANLTTGGRRLLERVSAALADADTVLVSTGSFDRSALGLLRDQIALPDLATDYAGPLAGLAAAVDWAMAQPRPPEILLLAAVDTPFLPPDYLPLLTAAARPAAIASFGGQPYPTSSAWRLDAVHTLAAEVRSGTAPHSLKRLGQAIGAVDVSFPPYAGGDPFANVNTREDQRLLERRAGPA
jgi:molybdopterin-guanine dinucleotide biosynthesis protein A